MLTHEAITNAVHSIASKHPFTKISYFGSYANGSATEKSDLDILAEFATPSVSLGHLIRIQIDLEEMLGIEVDVIHAPIPKTSFLEIDKMVLVYER